MKRLSFITLLALTFSIFTSIHSNAQKFSSLDKSPMDAAAFPASYRVSKKDIKIVYSRPQLNDRELSKLAPNGKVWRLGANEAAELTLYKDMKLGDTTVKAGIYTFYAIPGDKEWTAIISSDLNVWGSYFYNQENDVARLSVPVSYGTESLEAFSIAFTKEDNTINMHLAWGTTRVAVPFTL